MSVNEQEHHLLVFTKVSAVLFNNKTLVGILQKLGTTLKHWSTSDPTCYLFHLKSILLSSNIINSTVFEKNHRHMNFLSVSDHSSSFNFCQVPSSNFTQITQDSPNLSIQPIGMPLFNLRMP